MLIANQLNCVKHWLYLNLSEVTSRDVLTKGSASRDSFPTKGLSQGSTKGLCQQGPSMGQAKGLSLGTFANWDFSWDFTTGVFWAVTLCQQGLFKGMVLAEPWAECSLDGVLWIAAFLRFLSEQTALLDECWGQLPSYDTWVSRLLSLMECWWQLLSDDSWVSWQLFQALLKGKTRFPRPLEGSWKTSGKRGEFVISFRRYVLRGILLFQK